MSVGSGSAYTATPGIWLASHPFGAIPVRKMSSLPALVASLQSRKLSLLFLTAFGFYYALDAIFFLTYGFMNEKPYSADILLNLPPVLISTAMLGIVYWLAPRRD